MINYSLRSSESICVYRYIIHSNYVLMTVSQICATFCFIRIAKNVVEFDLEKTTQMYQCIENFTVEDSLAMWISIFSIFPHFHTQIMFFVPTMYVKKIPFTNNDEEWRIHFIGMAIQDRKRFGCLFFRCKNV